MLCSYPASYSCPLGRLHPPRSDGEREPPPGCARRYVGRPVPRRSRAPCLCGPSSTGTIATCRSAVVVVRWRWTYRRGVSEMPGPEASFEWQTGIVRYLTLLVAAFLVSWLVTDVLRVRRTVYVGVLAL